MSSTEKDNAGKNVPRVIKHQAVRLASAELQEELDDQIREMKPEELRQKLLERAARNLDRMSRNTNTN